jgi:hypothetical protein
MENDRRIWTLLQQLLLLMTLARCSFGFSPSSPLKRPVCVSSAPVPAAVPAVRVPVVALTMGLFDGFSKAFSNEGFQAQDQRVRASHILIKGDDIDLVFGKIQAVLGELNERVQQQQQQQQDYQEQDYPQTNLQAIFAELARRDSQCSSSAAQGGDLGLFGPGKMVQEFDMALFPDEGPPPPPGSVIGPVVTEFGCHVILVTQREENRDQVEAKLARIDPDAQ